MNEAKDQARVRDTKINVALYNAATDYAEYVMSDRSNYDEAMRLASALETAAVAYAKIAGGEKPEAVPNAGNIAGSISANGSASQSRVRKMYDALKTITKYQTPARLRKDSERLYGLAGDEAMDIAYENIIEHARAAIHGMRKPK